MVGQIISQTVIVAIAIGGITQFVIFKKQNKQNAWLGIAITMFCIVATLFVWLG